MAAIDDIAVLTSENVRLTYTLAGMGSRFAAFLADTIIISILVFALTVLFLSFGLAAVPMDEFGDFNIEQMSLVTAFYIFAVFLLLWGYYFLFEWISWGQTPGKQLLGIRVAMANGAPADTVACAVRNVVRIVDLTLAFFGVTFFVMIFTPRYQRLGDLAAGTVVVKRRRLTFDDVFSASRDADRAADSAAREIERSDLSVQVKINDAELQLLSRFVERRGSLPESVRRKLAKDLAGRIRARAHGDAADNLSDEILIEAVLKEQMVSGGQTRNRRD